MKSRICLRDGSLVGSIDRFRGGRDGGDERGGRGGLGVRGGRAMSRTKRAYRSWLSLLPRRLIVEWVTALSRRDWQATQVRTPGKASRRFWGIGSPQSSHSSALSPDGVRARARRIASFTVSSIWSCPAPPPVHPPAIFYSSKPQRLKCVRASSEEQDRDGTRRPERPRRRGSRS